MDLTQNQKIALRRFFHNCGYDDRNFHNLVIRYCLDSNASTVIIPLQDVLGLKNGRKIKYTGNNWFAKLGMEGKKILKGILFSSSYPWKMDQR